jgi:hypothetical protein
MSSIGATLTRQGWQVEHLDASQPDSAEQLRNLSPQAVLYETAHAPAALVLEVLGEQTVPLLIGVGPSSDRMLVLSGRPARAETTTDLVQLLVGAVSQALPTHPVQPQTK